MEAWLPFLGYVWQFIRSNTAFYTYTVSLIRTAECGCCVIRFYYFTLTMLFSSCFPSPYSGSFSFSLCLAQVSRTLNLRQCLDISFLEVCSPWNARVRAKGKWGIEERQAYKGWYRSGHPFTRKQLAVWSHKLSPKKLYEAATSGTRFLFGLIIFSGFSYLVSLWSKCNPKRL